MLKSKYPNFFDIFYHVLSLFTKTDYYHPSALASLEVGLKLKVWVTVFHIFTSFVSIVMCNKVYFVQKSFSVTFYLYLLNNLIHTFEKNGSHHT